jgi:Gnt-I system high-affinity gluconate transporter
MTIIVLLTCLASLILLTTWLKVNPFIAFLIISIMAGLLLGLPPEKVIKTVEKGFGDTMGSIVIIICLGAMLGKLVADSGAAQKITSVMMEAVGTKYIQWALAITGFIIGIPLFYNVGFVLIIPLIFSVVYRSRLPAVYVGLPMIASLSVLHGFLPPHPSPTALVIQFGGSVGMTLTYGILIAIPAIIVAGPVFSKTLKHIDSKPLDTFKPKNIPDELLPGTVNSFLTALLPVILLMITTFLPYVLLDGTPLKKLVIFIGEPAVVMLISLGVAVYTLGFQQGKGMKSIMATCIDAVKDVVVILLIIGGAGALKQVLTESGVSNEIALSLQHISMPPLILGWLISGMIRIAVGSATVAGLTAAGIIAPLVASTGTNPNLMVLAVGAGSLVLSHVNDSGFWMFKEYFNLTIKETLRSWTIMETIVAVIGLVGVLLLDLVI